MPDYSDNKKLTQEEILRRGIDAAETLNNTRLMTFLEMEKQSLLECISNTQPHELKTREALYAQHYALTSFFDGLRQYVEAGARVLEVIQQETMDNCD